MIRNYRNTASERLCSRNNSNELFEVWLPMEESMASEILCSMNNSS